MNVYLSVFFILLKMEGTRLLKYRLYGNLKFINKLIRKQFIYFSCQTTNNQMHSSVSDDEFYTIFFKFMTEIIGRILAQDVISQISKNKQ